ncbi:SMC family ATPase, partial [Candidatus Pacearchaeota archaeon]
MRFKRLKLRNIRSYREEEIHFPEGSLLLAGEVGAGKTSILLALEYALFGLQPGQKGSSLLRNDADVGEVELELETNGQVVLIERRLRRQSKGVSNEYAAITIDGEKIESSLTEIKSRVINLLGYPSEFVKKNNLLYRFTVYTPQEHMKQIILEDAETRLGVIRHIFGMEKHKIIKANIGAVVSELRSRVRAMQSAIAELEREKEELKTRVDSIAALERALKEKKAELAERTSLRRELELELSRLEEKIKEKLELEKGLERTSILIENKQANLKSLEKEIKELNSTLAEEKTHFDEASYAQLREELEHAAKLIEECRNKRVSISATIASLERELAETTQKRDRIFKIDICPTCLQSVSERHKHNILLESEKKLSEAKKKLSQMKEEIEKVIAQEQELKARLSALEEKKLGMELLKSKSEYFSKARARLSNLEDGRKMLVKDISSLQSYLNNLSNKLREFDVFDEEFKRKRAELEEVMRSEKRIEIELAEINKEIALSEREVERLKSRIKEKEEIAKKIEKYNEFSHWLSTSFLSLVELIETNLMFKLRQGFSEIFRKWFFILIPENDFDIQIDESFTPIILKGETEMPYEFLSGGERTALALAYR